MTKPNILPTLARVNSLLDYDPASGEFRWRISRGPIHAGQVAGRLNTNGYRQIQIDGRLYKAHRLAWLVTYGVSPPEQIDHMNGVRDDNRLVNLRLATRTENNRNTGLRTDNTSGYKGVRRVRNRWRAYIKLAGKYNYLGSFNTVEEAIAARHAAEILHFKEFRRQP